MYHGYDVISATIIIGISLWECIVVNLLAKEEPKQILLLQFYSMLSLPSHFVHLFLLTITIVNLCDRYGMHTAMYHHTSIGNVYKFNTRSHKGSR